MTNATTYNSISTQNVILWQYDKAPKFCGLVTLIENLGKAATETFWNYILNSVHGVFRATTADAFGLTVWGILTGVRRPILNYKAAGEQAAADHPMSDALYRTVMGARIRLMMSSGTLANILQYVRDIFGTGKVTVTDGIGTEIGSTVSGQTATAAVPSGQTGVTGASVDVSTFGNGELVNGNGSYAFACELAATPGAKPVWKLSGSVVFLKDYGIDVVGTPANGDSVTVAYAVSGITGVRVNRETFAGAVGETDAVKTFTRTASGWTLDGTSVNPTTTYGVTVRGTPVTGDTVTVRYVLPMAISYQKIANFSDINPETANEITKEELQALYDLDANSTKEDRYWQFYPAVVRDNAPPQTRFISFKGQYNAEKLAKSGVVANTTTKPNFFSGIANAGTEQAPVWVDWKGVFHPKTRSWMFYDEDGAQLTDEYGISYANGTWTLTLGEDVATQPGHAATVWSDYGVYFPAGSGTGGTFPIKGIVARFE